MGNHDSGHLRIGQLLLARLGQSQPIAIADVFAIELAHLLGPHHTTRRHRNAPQQVLRRNLPRLVAHAAGTAGTGNRAPHAQQGQGVGNGAGARPGVLPHGCLHPQTNWLKIQ